MPFLVHVFVRQAHISCGYIIMFCPFFVITIDREIQVPSAPQEKLAQLAPRVCQENPELKVSEDSQAQWSVTLFI